VRVLSVGDSGRRVDLAVRGALGPLLHRLGELPIEDLSFAPADLESIFLHYYDKGGAATE
jgi:ABC-2 type transport system ATP-binding protein